MTTIDTRGMVEMVRNQLISIFYILILCLFKSLCLSLPLSVIFYLTYARIALHSIKRIVLDLAFIHKNRMLLHLLILENHKYHGSTKMFNFVMFHLHVHFSDLDTYI
jgi:hypothetical protein